MQLHNLPKSHPKRGKRIGRGGKRGTYSGRGLKGQKSRAGRRIRPAERDLIIRLPKLRGFKNKPKTAKPIVINLRDLSIGLGKVGVAGAGAPTVVDRKFLAKTGFLAKGYRGAVKVLGDGEIRYPISLGESIAASKQAIAKIEKAGGTASSRRQNG